jgi:hypothetical protein
VRHGEDFLEGGSTLEALSWQAGYNNAIVGLRILDSI